MAGRETESSGLCLQSWVKKCGSLTLVFVLVPGKQEVFGLSDGLLHPVRGLGQPDGEAFTTPCLCGCLTFDPRVLPQITEQVGRCGPVAGTVDSAAVILCSQLVDSLVSVDPLTRFIQPNI